MKCPFCSFVDSQVKDHLSPRQENWQRVCSNQKVETSGFIKQATIFEDKIMLLTEPEHNRQKVIIMDYCTGVHINSHEIIIKK